MIEKDTTLEALKQAQNAIDRSKATATVIPVALVLIAFLSIILLFSVSISGESLSHVVAISDSANNQRAGISLISNIVKAADAKDVLNIETGPQGEALVLSEDTEIGRIETRIYQYQDNIVQEYVLAEEDFEPDNARILFPSSTFNISFDNDLLSVSTDEGTAHIALRCAQGVL